MEYKAPFPVRHDVRDNLKLDYFPGHSSLLDTSGNSHHGVITGATLNKRSALGDKFALSFDGANDKVVIPLSAADFRIDMANTIIFMIKVPADMPATGELHQFFNIESVSEPLEDYFWPTFEVYIYTDQKLAFAVSGPDETTWDLMNNQKVVSTAKINDNEWHLCVVTIDGTTMKLYIDNVLNDTEELAFETIGTPTDDLLFGTPLNPYHSHAKYELALFRKYNKVLSASELEELYRYLFHRFGIKPWSYK